MFWFSAAASEPTDDGRPKIGLVLSGGGARGGAHIGVLRVLEEMRVPVDYIVGTSMGSIIGGFYSVGYAPEQLETIVLDIDWDAAFRDAPERRRLSFRRKEDDDLPLWPVELGVGGGGAHRPSGLTTGARIEFIFRGLTLDVSGVHDFDDLRIPYRAVAADLDTGEMVVLDGGELALAMRASMSIPAVFSPVRIDGRLLVDGGIARNLPVDVAQEMGAEVIIAVDVGTPPKGASENLSAAGVYSQTFAVLSKQNVREQLELIRDDDVLIVPDLSEVRTADFAKIDKAIAAGEAAARAAADELRSFAIPEDEYSEFLERQRKEQVSLPGVRVDEIVIEGATRSNPDVLLHRIRTEPGDDLVPEVLLRDLERVSQAGEFQSVGFRLEPREDENKLVIETREKTWGPGYLRFGLGLESDFEGDTEYRLLANYRRANVNRLGAEWKTIVSLGDPAGLSTEFFQPLERSGFWFVAPSFAFGRDRDDTYLVNGDLEVIDTRTATGGIDVGIQLRNYGEVRLGIFRGLFDADPFTTTVGESTERDLGFVRFQAVVDQVDSATFPTEGNLTRLTVERATDSLGSDDEFDRLRFETLHAWTWNRNTFLGSVEFGSGLGSDIPFFEEFQLGGFLNLSGLARGSLRGDVKGRVSLGDYWKLGELGSFGRLYAGAFVEAGNVWQESDDVDLGDLLYSGTLFFGLDTRLVPIYLALGQAEGGGNELYFFMGKPFGR
jgi:NTE family protein